VADLTSGELRVAAFGALWEGPIRVGGRYADWGAHWPVFVMLVAIVGTICMIVGVNATRTLATQRGDVQLAKTIADRITVIAMMQVVGIAALWMTTVDIPLIALALAYPVLQLATMLVLAGVYARVAHRIRMAAAVDVF